MTPYIMYDILKPPVLWKTWRRAEFLLHFWGRGPRLALIRLWLRYLIGCAGYDVRYETEGNR